MIRTYLKKATIDAIQWVDDESALEILNWVNSYGVNIYLVWTGTETKMRIPTLEGPMHASLNDFIAKGVEDEFWAIKPDIMAKTYKEV